MRISREQMYMDIAHVVSKRATCFRLNVGAVIVANKRIVSIGYNGRPSGKPHCEGNACAGRFACQETIHAEANAIEYLPDMEDTDMHLYSTDSPCMTCASKIILHGGISRVLFQRPYRITSGLDDLVEQKIEVYQVMPSGIVIDWKSKAVLNA